MASMDDLRFWTRRRRALAEKIARSLDEGQSPPPETCEAHRMVSLLLEEMALGVTIGAGA